MKTLNLNWFCQVNLAEVSEFLNGWIEIRAAKLH